MSHIFISYSRTNQTYARRLADHLLELGFDVWIDDRIDYGDRWYRVIFKAIDECAALIVIMTPHSRESDWVEKEYLYAAELQKPVFPLLLEGARFPYFVNKQYVDVRPDRLPGEDVILQLERLTLRKSNPGVEVKADQTAIPATGTLSARVVEKLQSRVYDVLPDPFEWVEIPAGPVTLFNTWDDDPNVWLKKGLSRNFSLRSFHISKYPITNAQYARFVEVGGYKKSAWWTKAGWAEAERGKWLEPLFWGSKTWNRPEHPVVGVSWYEAVAFCNWLSHTSGEPIILPTEQRWQRAAQGDDRRAFPWGNEWDGAYCNNSVAPYRSSHTTPVDEFEARSSSPFGVVDMAGNVWEWCLTAYLTGENALDKLETRVLRGGSWRNPNDFNFRVAHRSREFSDSRNNNVGFRIVRV